MAIGNERGCAAPCTGRSQCVREQHRCASGDEEEVQLFQRLCPVHSKTCKRKSAFQKAELGLKCGQNYAVALPWRIYHVMRHDASPMYPLQFFSSSIEHCPPGSSTPESVEARKNQVST